MLRPAALLLLGGLLGCAPAGPAAAPAAPATPPPPRPPPTLSLSFLFEPTLTLRLWRDGQPFEGEAELTAEETEGQSGEAEKLSFSAGEARLSRDTRVRLEHKRGLGLRVGEQSVTLPIAGGTNPFACAQSIEALGEFDACRDMPPSADSPLDHCDSLGAQSWRRARERVAARVDGCWSAVDDATAARLTRVSSGAMLTYACQRLIEVAGPNPPMEQGLRLIGRCASFFPPDVRVKLDDELARRNLPTELAAALAGDTTRMRLFYNRYRSLAPDKAEVVRAEAARKFGPKNPARWFALRASVEALSLQGWRATLCDLDSASVEVAVQSGVTPRFSRFDPASPGPLFDGENTQLVRMVMDGYYLRRPRRPDGYSQFVNQVTASVRARTGLQDVRVTSTCTRGQHWYYAQAKAP